jgi:hypothetical protein
VYCSALIWAQAIGQAGDEVAGFDRGLAFKGALGPNHDNGLQPRPISRTTQEVEAVSAINGPAFSNFHAAMVVIHRAMIGVAHLGEAILSRELEEQGDVFVQVGLILLDGQQIVGPLLDDLGGNLGLRANGVNGNDAAAYIQQF